MFQIQNSGTTLPDTLIHNMANEKGKIFAIKKYAIHDGPNIRTTIFLKGCPLRCRWCHNPEGISPAISRIWVGEKCIGCKECLEKCPETALSFGEKSIVRNAEMCRSCNLCVDVCPALAHEALGWHASVEDVMAEIKKDIPFYDQSDGGVTFSGGEPLMQPDFLLELLQACGHLGIHRTVDTTAYVQTETILTIAAQTDLFLIDLKHMDSQIHKEYTGVENELILDNIRTLAERGTAMVFRIPLIGGVNDDPENLQRSAAFIATLPGSYSVDLLPYHSIAAAKYRKLQITSSGDEFQKLTQDQVSKSVAIFEGVGLHVQVGG